MAQITSITCPTCGRVLPENQARIVREGDNSSDYNKWFTSGFCSYSCYSPNNDVIKPASTITKPRLSIPPPNPTTILQPVEESAPPPEDKQALFEIVTGIAMLGFGALITAGTYWFASQHMTAGHYVLAWGPIAIGFGRLCQGLFDYIMVKYF